MVIVTVLFGILIGAVGALISWWYTSSVILTVLAYGVYGALGMLGAIAGIQLRQRIASAHVESNGDNKSSVSQ